MQIGMVGLGRMGLNMARRLLREGHEVVAYNRTPAKTEAVMQEGAAGAFSLGELVGRLTPPRIIWLMLPAGRPVDDHLTELAALLSPGDIVVDGGNSHYRDDLRRFGALAAQGIHYVDAGVSGGIWGLQLGYCLMIGAEPEVFRHLEPLCTSLAPPEGYLHCGPAGAGHFVKMVHNGIEYGMMQAYGEGFALLDASPYGGGLDFSRVARLWNQGSVIRSWLLELLETAFAADPKLEKLQGFVEDSGEGRWCVQEAVASGVAAPVTALSLFARFDSRTPDSFANRVLAALRREFGGHATRGGDSPQT
ncbi:MAG: phosphogluconate dehydrogenase (NAD(+)-dependent, decarboxylating) [Thermodesulfobacteriota bacterium]